MKSIYLILLTIWLGTGPVPLHGQGEARPAWRSGPVSARGIDATQRAFVASTLGTHRFQPAWSASLWPPSSVPEHVFDQLALAASNGVLAVAHRETLTAYDIQSGEVLWSFDASPDLVITGLTVHGDQFAAATNFGRLVSLSADDGRVLWEKALVSDPWLLLPDDDGDGFWALAGQAIQFSPEGGERRRFPFIDDVHRMKALAGGQIHTTQRFGNQYHSYPLTDAQTERTAITLAGRAYQSGPLVSGNIALVQGETSWFALDWRNARHLWSLGGDIMAAADDSSAFLVRGTFLYRHALADGELLQRYEVGTSDWRASSQPLVFNDAVVVGEGGMIYRFALDRPDVQEVFPGGDRLLYHNGYLVAVSRAGALQTFRLDALPGLEGSSTLTGYHGIPLDERYLVSGAEEGLEATFASAPEWLRLRAGPGELTLSGTPVTDRDTTEEVLLVLRNPAGGETTARLTLHLKRDGAPQARELRDQTLQAGMRLRLDPDLTGPEPSVKQWYRNGEAIRDADRAVLEIVELGLEDGGRYELRVTGPGGNLTTATQISVRPASRLGGPFFREGADNAESQFYPATLGNSAFRQAWSADPPLTSEFGSHWVTANGRLYLGVRDANTGTTQVQARDLFTGTSLWNTELPNSELSESSPQLTWHGGDLYLLAWLPEHVVCSRVSGTDGEILAQTAVPSHPGLRNRAAALVNEDAVYFTTLEFDSAAGDHGGEYVGRLHALDLRTLGPAFSSGEILMSQAVAQPPTVSLANETVYMQAGSRFIAIDGKTGKHLWEANAAEVIEPSILFYRAPRIDNGYAVVSFSNRYLFCYDLTRKQLAWWEERFHLTPPLMGNGVMHVFAAEGWLQLDPRTGAVMETVLRPETLQPVVLTIDRLLAGHQLYDLSGAAIGRFGENLIQVTVGDGYVLGLVPQGAGPPALTAWTNWPALTIDGISGLASLAEGSPLDLTMTQSGEGALVYLSGPTWMSGEPIDTNQLRLRGLPVTGEGTVTLGLRLEGQVVAARSFPVRVSPNHAPRIAIENREIHAFAGSSLVVRPEISGRRPIRVAWFRGNTPLTSDPVTGELRIPALTLAEAGVYRLVATNDLGSAETGFTLTVTEAGVANGDSQRDGRAFLPIAGAGTTVPLWSIQSTEPVIEAEAIDGGLVALLHLEGAHYSVEVRSLADGKTLWSADMLDAQLGYGAFVRASRGRLVAFSGRPGGLRVEAFTMHNGESLWHREWGAESERAEPDRWALEGTGLFHTSLADSVVLTKWDSASGQVLYTKEIPGLTEPRFFLTAGPDLDYLTLRGTFLALDPETGATRWSLLEHAANIFDPASRPTYLDGKVLLSSPPRLALHQALSGARLWERSLNTSGFAVNEAEIFVHGDSPGTLAVLDVATGRELRTFTLPEDRLPATSQLAVSHDRLYLNTVLETLPFPPHVPRPLQPKLLALDTLTGGMVADVAPIERGASFRMHEGHVLTYPLRVHRWSNLPVLTSTEPATAYGGLSFTHERRLNGDRIIALGPDSLLPEGIDVAVTEDGRGLRYTGTSPAGLSAPGWVRVPVMLEDGTSFRDEWVLPRAPDPLPHIEQPVVQGSIDVEPGGPLRFEWSVVGPGPFTYEWRRDDLPLTDIQGSVLSITSVGADDAGVYTLTVRNAHGSDQLAITVRIATVPDSARSWGYGHGNAQRTRAVDVLLKPSGEMSQRWARTVGTVYGGVRTDTERAFAVSKGSSEDRPALRVVSLTDGALLWEHPLRGPFTQPQDTALLSVDGDQVFIHYVREDSVSELKALDTVSGRELWSTITQATQSPVVRAEPVADAGSVRLLLGELPTVMVAWDRNTGALIETVADAPRSGLARRDGDWLGFHLEGLRRFRDNGQLVWQRAPEHLRTTPLIAGDAVIVPHDESIDVLDWGTGALRYTLPNDFRLFPPACDGVRLVHFNGAWQMSELATGTRLGTLVPSSPYVNPPQVSITRNHIVLAGDHRMELLDKRTLASIAIYQIPPPSLTHAIPVEGGILLHQFDALSFISTDGQGNRAPTMVLPELVRGREHEVLELIIPIDDDGPARELRVSSPDKPDWLELTITEDGQLRLFTHIDFAPSARFTVTVTDGQGSRFDGILNVAIEEVDDPPTTTPGSLTVLEEDQDEISVRVWEWFQDDEGPNLAYEILEMMPQGALEFRIQFTNVFVRPSPNYFGEAVATIKATDHAGASVMNTLPFRVLPFPDAPQPASEVAPLTHGEEGPQRIDLSSFFSDADGDFLRFEIGEESGTLIRTTNLEGSIFTIHYQPYLSGQTRLVVRAIDPSELSGEITLLLTIPAFETPGVSAASPALDRQTGLFRQVVSVTNRDARTIGGFELMLPSLAGDALLFNATSVDSSGLALVRHPHPLAPGARVDVTLSWHSPTRRIPPAVEILGVLAFPQDPVVEPEALGSSLGVARMHKLADGSVLLEIASDAEQSYEIFYSDDGRTWRRSLVPLRTSQANRTQWIDAGPPATWPHPAEIAMRLYRFRPIINPHE